MVDRLPELIEPLVLADKQAVLKGEFPLQRLDRLSDLLCSNNGMIDINLAFGEDGRLAKIEGTVHGVLILQCQRCLQPLTWTVDHSLRLGIVASIEQADRLAHDYEPLLLEGEGKIPLKNVIEDEILLSLPDFPKHPYECFKPAQSTTIDDQKKPSTGNQANGDNPFAILAKLKNTGDF